MLLSRITKKIHTLSKYIEEPILSKLQQEGGLVSTYEKLNTHWFKSLKIDTVLDIGANTGQFTRTISALLPKAHVYSFEPLPECFEELQSFAEKHNNIEAFNIGIGDESGTISFEQNESSQSSSFRKMTDTHKTAFPFTEKSTTVEVKIDKLDSISQNIDFGDSVMIKIDVQGYEDKVLGGGKETILRARIVIVETSFVTLYEAQPLFDDVYNIFKLWGFSFFGMIDQIADPITGRILQGDAIFIK